MALGKQDGEGTATAPEGAHPAETSFGEELVGIDFNHAEGGAKDKVTRLKEIFAEAANIVQEDAAPRMSPAEYDIYGRGAIDRILDAQMRAVKCVTKKTK